MNKKLHSLLFSIGSIFPIEEISNNEKRNSSLVIIFLKSNCISNFFKNQSDEHINSHNQLKKYGGNRNCNHSISYFQKTSNNIDYLLNEFNLNLNRQNKVSQPT
jgi:hypothetical protein